MQGYTQIRTNKSKSIDFADLSFSPKPTSNPTPNPVISSPKTKQIKTHKKTQAVFAEQGGGEDELEDVGQRFGVVLSRTCSVSSAQRVRTENPSLINSAVMRAFSMRKSSSVSEGYCRIHDQCDHLSPIADVTACQTKKKGRFLKVCKRLFGFNHLNMDFYGSVDDIQWESPLSA